MITVLVADDHVLFRQGLVKLLEEQGIYEVLAEAGDGEEAVGLAEQLAPQVVVVDVEMPRLNGVEAAKRIRDLSPNSRIIAVSMYGEPYYRERMFRAGALGYVMKSEAIKDLIAAIGAALRGEQFCSALAVERNPVVGAARSAELDKYALSAREREVMRLLAEGKRNREIAEVLGISAKTVETYRARIMHKLGIDNLPELVKFAIRAGITSTARR